MLPKSKRLNKAQVAEVLSRGHGRRGGTLSLKYLETTTPFRSAVVISKRVARTAVRRNYVRRVLCQALRGASLPPTGHAILFVQSIPEGKLAAVFAAELKKIF